MKIVAFDSGIGGLTALAPILRKYPSVHLTYFGDLANLPYGTKSPEAIHSLTQKNLRWLLGPKGLGEDADLAVIACNTASAFAADLMESFPIPVVGVIEPGCRAAEMLKAPRIVVLATSSTVNSGAYLKTLSALGIGKTVISKACPLFVPLVEENLHLTPAAEWIARHYLDGVLHPGDAVILGCTHYPFMVPLLQRIYPQVHFMDAGAALIQEPRVREMLSSADSKTVPADFVPLRMVFSDLISESRLDSMVAAMGLAYLKRSLEVVRT